MGTNGIISASKLNTEHSRSTLSETRKGNTHVKPHQLRSRQNFKQLQVVGYDEDAELSYLLATN